MTDTIKSARHSVTSRSGRGGGGLGSYSQTRGQTRETETRSAVIMRL